ncbi:MAG TPA: inositol monophosphatase [Candidatus Paceibacterota bacterium]|nr:inositol monophosphatase [Candidatus Paceibacterota bacterium]
MTKKDILIKAAHAGGKVLRRYFGQALQIEKKSMLSDVRTKADLESERAILKILKSKLPKYNIHSEEEGETNKNSDYTLVIDPLDGTNNFVLGIANFSISIALFYKNKAVIGVIYQPILNQTYYAEKYKGAFLNGKRIKVSKATHRKNMTVAYSCGYKTKYNRISNIRENLIKFGYKRTLFNWSPANDYCLLAGGKIEAVVTDPGTEIYDFGAGKLIAVEAGACLTDQKAKKESSYLNDSFILSNHKKVNQSISKLIENKK